MQELGSFYTQEREANERRRRKKCYQLKSIKYLSISIYCRIIYYKLQGLHFFGMTGLEIFFQDFFYQLI
jgi:hypothetical protein